MNIKMYKFWPVIFIIATIQLTHVLGDVSECFHCQDQENFRDCMKVKEACNSNHEKKRCLKLKYKNGNGNTAYDARCSHEAECIHDEPGLCLFKRDCKVEQCCERNICNSPASIIQMNLLIMIVSIAASIYMLTKNI